MNKFLFFSQQFTSKNSNSGGSISDFLVLDLGDVNKNLGPKLSTSIDLKIVVLSFATLMCLFCDPELMGTKILPIPLGPRVALTKSAITIAPTKKTE